MANDKEGAPATVLDEEITSKLGEYVEADQAAREVEGTYRALQSELSKRGSELQKLLIARSVLRDGKAYGLGDANTELNQLQLQFRRGEL